MNRHLLQLAFTLLLVSTSRAYYQAEQGRWLNRDPIGEWGGITLYVFVGNNPVNFIDSHGLQISQNEVPSSATSPAMSCCDGQSYSGSSHCCCHNGKVGDGSGAMIVSKAKEATEITTYKWTGESTGNGVPVHHWITWGNGESADANGTFLLGYGDGIVRSPALGQDSTDNTKATTVMLSPCEYDFKKLNNCLSKKIQDMSGNKSIYGGGGGRICEAFVFGFLNECKAESTGCTMP